MHNKCSFDYGLPCNVRFGSGSCQTVTSGLWELFYQQASVATFFPLLIFSIMQNVRGQYGIRPPAILISSSYLYIICLYKRESPMYRFQCDRRPGETAPTIAASPGAWRRPTDRQCLYNHMYIVRMNTFKRGTLLYIPRVLSYSTWHFFVRLYFKKNTLQTKNFYQIKNLFKSIYIDYNLTKDSFAIRYISKVLNILVAKHILTGC